MALSTPLYLETPSRWLLKACSGHCLCWKQNHDRSSPGIASYPFPLPESLSFRAIISTLAPFLVINTAVFTESSSALSRPPGSWWPLSPPHPTPSSLTSQKGHVLPPFQSYPPSGISLLSPGTHVLFIRQTFTQSAMQGALGRHKMKTISVHFLLKVRNLKGWFHYIKFGNLVCYLIKISLLKCSYHVNILYLPL